MQSKVVREDSTRKRPSDLWYEQAQESLSAGRSGDVASISMFVQLDILRTLERIESKLDGGGYAGDNVR